MEFIYDYSSALHKVMFTLLWSRLSTEKDAAIIKLSLNQLSDCSHWFLCTTTTTAANRVFSKPEKKTKPTTWGGNRCFCKSWQNCVLIYFALLPTSSNLKTLFGNRWILIQANTDLSLACRPFLRQMQSEIVTPNLVFGQIYKWFSNEFRLKEFRDFSCSPDFAC